MMPRSNYLGRALITGLLSIGSVAQEQVKPLDPTKAMTSYSFPLQVGSLPYHFEIQLDRTRTIIGVQVFRPGEPSAFQTLTACKRKDGLPMKLTDDEEGRELLKHQDLNFDGYEDLQLLRYYVPHLGKSLFCIYTWNPRDGRFKDAPVIPDTDPVADPQNKTITVHEDWTGGIFKESTYRWNGATLQLVAENGRLYGSDRSDCGFTDYCSRLIKGKMVTTAERSNTCDANEPPALVCPSIISENIPAKRSSYRRGR